MSPVAVTDRYARMSPLCAALGTLVFIGVAPDRGEIAAALAGALATCAA